MGRCRASAGKSPWCTKHCRYCIVAMRYWAIKMTRLDFKDLAFFERPDLTPYLIHLTKNTKAQVMSILRSTIPSAFCRQEEFWGSDKKEGFVKGPLRASLHIPWSQPISLTNWRRNGRALVCWYPAS